MIISNINENRTIGTERRMEIIMRKMAITIKKERERLSVLRSNP